MSSTIDDDVVQAAEPSSPPQDETADGSTGPGSRARSARARSVALLLLVAGLAGAWLTQRAVAAHQQSRFDYEVRRIESAVQERMSAYVQVLRGGLGLFRTAGDVDLEQWLRYVATLELGQRYPGFKSLSYAQAVSTRDLPAFLDRIHAQPIPPGMSTPALLREFRLRGPVGSSGTPALHSPIVFVAPMIPENERVLGVDMMQEPIRRAAMQRAAESADVILSPRLNLSGQGDLKAGFIAYLAVKDGDALRGWLTAAFRAEDFMHGLLGAGPGALEFEVYDGGEARADALLYSTAGIEANGAPRALLAFPSSSSRLSRLGRLELPGRQWTLRYRATPGFVPLTDRIAPVLVALGGLLLALLFHASARAGERLRAAHREVAMRNVRLQREVRERERAEAQVRHQATHDPLTGLANRALFMDRLQTALERSRRRGRSVALAYLDVDGFKAVNDTHGHLAGDDLLQAIAARVLARVRKEDTLARLGGDEFAVVFEEVSEPPLAVQAACTAILESLREPFDLPRSAAGASVCVGASIGVALFPLHGDDSDALIAAADGAMYQAKRAGKGRCRVVGEDGSG